MRNAIFIGATGQDVGKTTICLGIISGLIKRFKNVGFTKPVGQFHMKVEDGRQVDKDAILFKKRFHLKTDWDDMSPVIIPAGYTRDYIDEKVSGDEMQGRIISGFKHIEETHDYTVVEGTGHIGVGSIIGLSNAKVASLLGLDMVIIVTGGLGSAIDSLILNMAMCEKYGVNVRGIILNRVFEEKREMITHYIGRALEKYSIPLIGVIPFNEFLTTPTMNDFETLFDTKMLAADQYRWRHFHKTRLVAGASSTFAEDFKTDELIITPSSRTDIVEKVIEFSKQGKVCSGMILTGRHKPLEEIKEAMNKAQIPTLYAPINSYNAMKQITGLITKTRTEDTTKVDKAIDLVEPYINFDLLTQSSHHRVI